MKKIQFFQRKPKVLFSNPSMLTTIANDCTKDFREKISIQKAFKYNNNNDQSLSNDLMLVDMCSKEKMCHLWSLVTLKRVKSIHLDIDEANDFEILDFRVIRRTIMPCLFANGSLRIFDLMSGKCLKKYKELTDNSSQIHLVFNESIAFSIGSKIVFYCMETFAQEKTFFFKQKYLQLLSVFASNKNMLVSFNDNNLELVDYRNGKIAQKYIDFESGVFKCVQLFSNETLFASVAENKINIWNVKEGVCLKTLRTGSGLIYDLKFSTNENGKSYLISCANSGFIKVWDCDDEFKLVKKLGNVKYKPYSVKNFASNKLISISLNDEVRIWEINSGKLIERFYLGNYISRLELIK